MEMGDCEFVFFTTVQQAGTCASSKRGRAPMRLESTRDAQDALRVQRAGSREGRAGSRDGQIHDPRDLQHDACHAQLVERIIPHVLLLSPDEFLGGSNVCGDEILHIDAFVVALFYSFRRVLDHDEYRIGVVVLGLNLLQGPPCFDTPPWVLWWYWATKSVQPHSRRDLLLVLILPMAQLAQASEPKQLA